MLPAGLETGLQLLPLPQHPPPPAPPRVQSRLPAALWTEQQLVEFGARVQASTAFFSAEELAHPVVGPAAAAGGAAAAAGGAAHAAAGDSPPAPNAALLHEETDLESDGEDADISDED